MAILMQAGNISWEHLTQNQIDAIDMMDSATWLEITDGDWSLQNEIDLDAPLTTDELIAGINSGDIYGYICADKEIDGVALAELRALADDVTDRHGEILFFVEAR